jgi:outer membrane lipopolysaccharide assembly protein LptE/RlpB
MLRLVTLVRIEVTGEHIASIIRVTRISELETTLAVTATVIAKVFPSSPILVTLMMKVISSSETSILT